MRTSVVNYRRSQVDGINIFFREAGHQHAPVVLLLHGYPTSSHMFRNLIPMLSAKYRVIAPDLPGFGYSDKPDHESFKYTFDNIASYIQRFTEQLNLTRFAIYVFDYGAPVGFRLALANPEKITGIISQNGNAYLEGLSSGWNPIQKYWQEPTPENRNALRMLTEEAATKWQYLTGVEDESLVAPESYTLDQHFLDQKGNVDIQLDLFKDYANNVALYPAFQSYFRKYQPPFLAVWGDKDPFFLPEGAKAFKKDISNATITFFNTGHFALETHVNEIAEAMLAFLDKLAD
jgi:pimeloyl-ACP methyl ester carboxylesterase